MAAQPPASSELGSLSGHGEGAIVIWLYVAMSVVIGLVRANEDARAGPAFLTTSVLAAVLAIGGLLAPAPAAGVPWSAAVLLGVLGGAPPWNDVPFFLPGAHLAYPMLTAYAVAPLGRTVTAAAVGLVLSAVGFALSCHSVVDVAAGLALGALLGRATFRVVARPWSGGADARPRFSTCSGGSSG